ncbi:MAG: TIGR02680 family protein, partial [Acidobacteriota bacterium]
VESHRAALEARDAAIEALLVAFDSWRRDLQVLDVGTALARGALDGEAFDDETFAEALREWGRELSGPEPLARLVQSAADRAREIVAQHMATLTTQIGEGRSERDELEAEARSLEEGAGVEPPVPHTRDPQARSARSDLGGAPLWQLCDFRDDVSTDVRAAAEAALEASGLLDAWVTPDGSLLDRSERDTAIVGRGAPAGLGDGGTPTATLEAILRPDPAASGFGVAPVVVMGILRGIGWAANQEGRDPGRVWVSGDGRFRVGPLHGRWQKGAAQYVGASARRAERRRRLAEIARRLEAVEARLAELSRERDETLRQRDAIRDEVAAAPTVEGVRDAASEVASKQRELARARQRQAEAESRAHERRQSRDAAVAERDRAAEDLGLVDHLDDLEALRRSVHDYEVRLGGLEPVLELHRSAAREMASRRAELEKRSDQCLRLRDELVESERLSNRAEAERDTLEESLGASVEELLLKLDAARAQRAERRKGIEEAGKEEIDLRMEEARSEERIAAETDSLAGFEDKRRAAIGSLSDVVALRLVAIAAPEVDAGAPADWSVTRAVDVARRLEVELAGVDADREVWDRLQGRVHERFRRLEQTLLPHNYEPSLTTPSDTIVVKVPFQGQSKDVDEFRSALREETETRDRVLAAREREILENHLLSEVSLHLHDRLRDAEELVQEINAEIEDRPMSTGMKLRFDWSPRTAEVEHLAEARRLLLTDHRMRSPDENRSIGRFLQNLIEAQRESNEDGTWADHLSRALDYRAWHHFAIEQSQGGPWRRLTRRTHGTGSGGEKAIALTVPQFAAAAAHYRSARPDAPRLILLDEAFVGVDADMRAKCMGLLEAFDLDFVMTSEREWGCYPTLSGLAIYQLATHAGLDAVGLTRWVWNGKERVREEASRSLVAPAARADGLSSKETGIF